MFYKKNQWKAWLYLAPAIVLLIVFTAWPIINTIMIAFQDGYDIMEHSGLKQDLRENIDELGEPDGLFDFEYYSDVFGAYKDYFLADPDPSLDNEEGQGYFALFPWGIENFKTVFQNGQFATSMRNTIILCFLTVPVSTFLALLIAVALNSIKPFQKLLQTIFFLPYVTNSIAVGLVFSAMFQVIGASVTGDGAVSVGVINNVIQFFVDDILRASGFLDIGFVREAIQWVSESASELYGWAMDLNFVDLLNNLIQKISGQPIKLSGWIYTVLDYVDFFEFTKKILIMFSQFLFDVSNLLLKPNGYIDWVGTRSHEWAKYTVVLVYIVWNALPFKILVLLGGLQSVNKQYYDAAKIDATPRSRVFTRITVPLLSPMITYVVITGFIGGFKEYSSVVSIFDDRMAQRGELSTMVGLIYQYIDGGGTGYGVAAAAALVLFVIIFIVTMINLRISKKNTHY